MCESTHWREVDVSPLTSGQSAFAWDLGSIMDWAKVILQTGDSHAQHNQQYLLDVKLDITSKKAGEQFCNEVWVNALASKLPPAFLKG
jgi:hypothetical protein